MRRADRIRFREVAPRELLVDRRSPPGAPRLSSARKSRPFTMPIPIVLEVARTDEVVLVVRLKRRRPVPSTVSLCRSSCRCEGQRRARARNSRARRLADRASAPPRARATPCREAGVYLPSHETNLRDERSRRVEAGSRLVRPRQIAQNSNAVTRSTRATATCPTTSRLRSVQRRPATRASCRLSAGICERRVACSAGASAHRDRRHQDEQRLNTTTSRLSSRRVNLERQREAATAAREQADQHLHQ